MSRATSGPVRKPNRVTHNILSRNISTHQGVCKEEDGPKESAIVSPAAWMAPERP